jgi:hypothetical protein
MASLCATKNGEEPQHGHRLQDVQQWQHDLARADALGRDVSIREGEEKRRGKGDEHPQHRACGVVGDERYVERKRRRVELVEAHPHVAAQNHEQPQQREAGQDDDRVDPAEARAPLELLTGCLGVRSRGHAWLHGAPRADAGGGRQRTVTTRLSWSPDMRVRNALCRKSWRSEKTHTRTNSLSLLGSTMYL